jgi:probable rRNA maturation factor
MKIEINNRTKSKINLNLVKRVVREFARAYKIKQKEISLAFVSDAEIKKLNKIYRRIDRPTDILTFTGEADSLGELVIDYSQIKRQAGRFGNTAEKELIFILTHGLLHLIGYNDETEKGRLEMIKRGEEFMKKLKVIK